jgi:hypothetical protein
MHLSGYVTSNDDSDSESNGKSTCVCYPAGFAPAATRIALRKWDYVSGFWVGVRIG